MTGSRVTEVKGKDPGGSREAMREGERKGRKGGQATNILNSFMDYFSKLEILSSYKLCVYCSTTL